MTGRVVATGHPRHSRALVPPSFPRKRESTPALIIPAHARCHSRARGNPPAPCPRHQKKPPPLIGAPAGPAVILA